MTNRRERRGLCCVKALCLYLALCAGYCDILEVLGRSFFSKDGISRSELSAVPLKASLVIAASSS